MATAKKFMMHRNRTVSSTCGISIEFKKGELHLVPPAMFEEVLAKGGVPESELEEDDLPKSKTSPEAIAERRDAIFKAFKVIILRNDRSDFTAGGAPHVSVLARETGWSVDARERDTLWTEYPSLED
jgi:hypothetical protein